MIMNGGLALASKRRREPNGRHQREKEYAPTHVKRLIEAAMQGLREPEWGTELGRLLLNNAITPTMYAAGKRWREQAQDYHHAIGVFPVKSATLERGSLSEQPDPINSEVGRKLARREADQAERFFAAHAALMSAGARACSTVRALCERNEMPCGFDELMQLRKGLLVLVCHYWDLTGEGKSQQMSKRHVE